MDDAGIRLRLVGDRVEMNSEMVQEEKKKVWEAGTYNR